MSDLSKYVKDLSAEKRELFELLLKEKKESVSQTQIIPRRKDSSTFPVSFGQQRLWFLDQWEPDSPAYNLPQAVRLSGRLDLAALQQSLNEIVRRHEALRATFVAIDGQPIQIVASALTWALPIIDIRALSPAEREAEVQRLITREAKRPFDLARGPLLRATLLQLAQDERIMLLTLHHIVSDGWSNGVLIREIGVLYQAFSAGRPSPLPELPIQYADFAHWQRQWLQGEVLEKQLAYWKRQLAGAPPLLELPMDHPRPPVQTYSGARYYVRFSRPLTEALKAQSQREGASLFMTLLAAFQTLLYRYSGQQDILVGTPVANRNRAEIESLIGFFVNTLVIRTDLSGNPAFRELLRQVRSVALEAQDHQDLPFEKLIDELNLERNMSHAPLFQAMIALQNAPLPTLSAPGLTISPMQIDTGTAQFDLSLDLYEASDGLQGWFEYNTDLFETETITRIAVHLETLLQDLSSHPERRLADLDLLSLVEREQLLIEWNASAADYPHDQCAHQLFEAQVERTPDAIAVICGEAALTYRELDCRANQLAHHLRSLGVKPGVFVGVCLERSLALMVSLLGVLKAGGAYMPLDPSYPQERLAFMLGDAQTPVLLTQTHLAKQLPVSQTHVVCLDADWKTIACHPWSNPSSSARADDLIYLIYTSGSTGIPKGVLVTHRAVVNHNIAVAREFELRPADRMLQFATINFDTAVEEIFPTWLCGATLVLRPGELVPGGAELVQLVEQHHLTLLDLPTAYWHTWVAELAQADLQLPPSLRLVIVGGEAVSAESYAVWREITDPNIRWLNTYGPTEATVIAALYEPEAEAEAPTVIPIGRPIANVQIYLLDPHMQPVPIGAPGEICIGGAGVARGYLNRPELSEKNFIPHPFSTEPETRLYRTGDLARYRADGNIEFLGRVDQQVKVRGFRVEPGEIETTLLKHSQVRQAAVIAQTDGAGSQRLVAYFVPDVEKLAPAFASPAEDAPLFLRSAPLTSELRIFLKEKLPDYMVPAVFVPLEAMPLLPNGKIDRRALPIPDLTRAAAQETFVAPRTDMETMLAEIWSKLLGTERVGVHDNFFDWGGHSLLATQVMARVRKAFQVDLPLRTLFDHPTMAGLSIQIQSAQEAQQGVSVPPIVPVARDRKIPLSFSQEQLWLIDQLSPGNVAYSIPATVRISGPLNVVILQQCFDAMLQRHEIFRTTYARDSEYPIQIVGPARTFPLTVIDVQGSPAPEQEALLLAAEVTRRPIDLVKGPIARGYLFKLDEQDHALLMLMHHLVIDEWSSEIITREMKELYEAFSEKRLPMLPDLPIQYADFAYWQRQWMQGDVLETKLAYWQQQLADAPASLDLPTDRPRPPAQTFRGGYLTVPLPKTLFEEILTLSRQASVTPYMTLLSVFKTLLYRYTGQTDILIGTPIANRGQVEVEGTVGFFLNTLLLRTDLSGNPTFLELLERVRETCLGAYAHRELYFEKLVQEFQPQRDPSRNPLFTVLFVFNRNFPMADVECAGMTISYLHLPRDVARLDLTMYIFESVRGVSVQINYNSDLFNESTISRMIEQYKILLAEVVQDPTRRIADLPLLQEVDQRRLLAEWNTTDVEYPRDVCIHELFEAQAIRTPNAIAAIFEGNQLTYRELDQQANQLAHHLKSLGIKPGAFVAVYLHRSLEMIPALLGILKAGGAYVPLEIGFPAPRLQWILASLNVRCLITQSVHLQTVQELQPQLPALQHVICLDHAQQPSLSPEDGVAALPTSVRLWKRSDLEQLSQEKLPLQVCPEDIAYIIFTSGSTGTPKGVVVQNRPVINLIDWVNKTFQIKATDRVLFITSLCFDLSVYDIFGLLAAGGSIRVVSDQDLREPEQLLRLLCTESVTFWDSAPAALQQLAPFFASADTSNENNRLRLVFLSGDWIPVTLPDQVRNTFPDVQVISLGGATEATVWSNYYPIGEVNPTWASIPYGRPIQNARYYILDSRLTPCPTSVPGDLYIGGECLSLGYVNEPILTATKYLPDPFSEMPEAVMYRTGDRARFWPDGNMEFLGRLDFQVKIRGYRIELGEIETTLAQHPAVLENLIIALEGEMGPKDKRLVAYVVTRSGQSLTVTDLRVFLKKRLPEYMVPSAFVMLEAFPLTANGKIDRKALPLPDQTRPDLEGKYVAPRNVVEELVAHLWAQVLGLERVGVYDNFFELGGHSLSAIQILSRLSDTFQTEFPLQALFEEPTVTAVAAHLIDNEAKPGQAEKIAQIWKRVEMASEEELEEALEQKRRG